MTSNPNNPDLSIWEKLDLVPGYLSVISTLLYGAMTGAFRGKTGAKSYNMHVVHTAVRKMVTRLSPRQAQCVHLQQLEHH